MINSETRLLAVIGYPCRHSLSPIIHNHFIAQHNRNAAYAVFEFEPDRLEAAYRGLVAMDFIGFNVTMPYKQSIYNLVDSCSDAARATGAVNTVKIMPGLTTRGFNTDVEGFVRCLDKKKFKWSGAKTLVIGAGGVARSSIYGLLQKPIKKIYVYNRNFSHAKNIRNLYKNDDRIEIIKYLNNVSVNNFDLIVNCTPLGMDVDKHMVNKMPVPGDWSLEGKYIVEMVYKPTDTLLAKKSKREGAVLINGVEMLISQAAYSFKIWFDLEDIPDTENISQKIENTILKRGL
ncbi:MAG: shikimate dehydrogenase [Actinomycetia bacterium]|nr:shikimate dehydrogenase [Actinomycetes bacterium]